MYKTIEIAERKELEIYMNPQRQRLLKIMEWYGTPMTPKQLSDEIGISPSAVTHHLKKLEMIGLVELDHTELIKGIQAKYYRKVPAIVNLKGNQRDSMQEEKLVLGEYFLQETWKGFCNYVMRMEQDSPEEQKLRKPQGKAGESEAVSDAPKDEACHCRSVSGDFMNGTFYLTEEEAEELKKLIEKFHKTHLESKKGTIPWEIALIAYPGNEKEM